MQRLKSMSLMSGVHPQIFAFRIIIYNPLFIASNNFPQIFLVLPEKQWNARTQAVDNAFWQFMQYQSSDLLYSFYFMQLAPWNYYLVHSELFCNYIYVWDRFSFKNKSWYNKRRKILYSTLHLIWIPAKKKCC